MKNDLKYKVIATREQYFEYCNLIIDLLESGSKDQLTRDEIELLSLLIDTWDREHDIFKDEPERDPIQLLLTLMQDHKMKAVGLAEILGVSKGLVSDILHYKKGMSKEVVRKLADHFKMVQEAFNRPYPLMRTSAPASKSKSSMELINSQKKPLKAERSKRVKEMV